MWRELLSTHRQLGQLKGWRLESSESCHSVLQLMALFAGTSAGAVAGASGVSCLCDHLASSEHGNLRVSIPRGGSIARLDSLRGHMASLLL